MNIILSGLPGSGKGTQATKLVEEYGLVHISTGEIIRDEVARQTELGKQLEEDNKNGKYAPDDVLAIMVENKIYENKGSDFVFDGYPRTVDQMKTLMELFTKYDMTLNHIIHLDVPREIVIERLLKRGETSNRPDDQSAEVILARQKEFYDKSTDLIKYYAFEKTFAWVKSGGTPDEVFDKIKKDVIDEN